MNVLRGLHSELNYFPCLSMVDMSFWVYFATVSSNMFLILVLLCSNIGLISLFNVFFVLLNKNIHFAVEPKCTLKHLSAK